MSKKKKIDVDEMILEAIQDLKTDRKSALEFLEDLKNQMSKPEEHVIMGPIAVQYLGKAQKASDQIIKLIEVLKKSELEQSDEEMFSNLLGDDANEDSLNKTQKENKERQNSTEDDLGVNFDE